MKKRNRTTLLLIFALVFQLLSFPVLAQVSGHEDSNLTKPSIKTEIDEKFETDKKEEQDLYQKNQVENFLNDNFYLKTGEYKGRVEGDKKIFEIPVFRKNDDISEKSIHTNKIDENKNSLNKKFNMESIELSDSTITEDVEIGFEAIGLKNSDGSEKSFDYRALGDDPKDQKIECKLEIIFADGTSVFNNGGAFPLGAEDESKIKIKSFDHPINKDIIAINIITDKTPTENYDIKVDVTYTSTEPSGNFNYRYTVIATRIAYPVLNVIWQDPYGEQSLKEEDYPNNLEEWKINTDVESQYPGEPNICFHLLQDNILKENYNILDPEDMDNDFDNTAIREDLNLYPEGIEYRLEIAGVKIAEEEGNSVDSGDIEVLEGSDKKNYHYKFTKDPIDGGILTVINQKDVYKFDEAEEDIPAKPEGYNRIIFDPTGSGSLGGEEFDEKNAGKKIIYDIRESLTWEDALNALDENNLPVLSFPRAFLQDDQQFQIGWKQVKLNKNGEPIIEEEDPEHFGEFVYEDLGQIKTLPPEDLSQVITSDMYFEASYENSTVVGVMGESSLPAQLILWFGLLLGVGAVYMIKKSKKQND